MFRWWGIRHIRYWWLRRQVWAWAKMWAKCGIGLGIPNPSDLQQLDAIWRGEV